MAAALTLLRIVGDKSGVFDGSVNGISLAQKGNVKVLPADAGISIDHGWVDAALNKDLNSVQSFTIEATITPTKVGGARQNIAEAQAPSVALFIDDKSKLVGAVHTAAGWMTVDSGVALIKAGAPQRITFVRDANGKNEIAIDGKTVGSSTVPGPIQNVGALGFRIGVGMDGVAFPYSGVVKDFSVRAGVAADAFFQQKTVEAQGLENTIRAAGIKQISVSLMPDESHARLQQVRDMMNAAGVQTLSDLDTLSVTRLTPLARGQMLVAAKKSAVKTINWVNVAKQLRAGDASASRHILATYVVNQNSAAFLATLPARPASISTVRELPPIAPRVAAAPPITGPVAAAPTITARVAAVSPITAEVAAVRPTLSTSMLAANLVETRANTITAVDSTLSAKLLARSPAAWPVISVPPAKIVQSATVPIDSAVVIAGTLDLTNQQLVVEPNVQTVYIIAETVLGADAASITWRRPGGQTPDRGFDPDLNGRSFPGVQTKPNSRDGLDGGDGQPGGPGLAGANGLSAPNIEMWVKNMSGLPNLDFNGEDGIAGGRGQRGGNGGNGGSGNVGHRWWLFGWHCDTEGGNGGDGGNGGRGGDGGRGGNGGNGGKVTIGVLTGTLATTVANKPFKLKNQAGRRGQGGPGGSGGPGGAGGHSGNGETCHGARDGHNGAQGQPGQNGAPGWSDGLDAEVTLFEFTQAAWDDLMTRPWITQISPTDAFPGDKLVVRGSRFTAADVVLVAGAPLVSTVNADESLSVTLPLTIAGGQQQVFVRRADGVESNRVTVGIKPELDPIQAMAQGSTPTLTGRAFLPGAAVLFNGAGIPANVSNATTLTFAVPGTGGTGSAGGTVSVQVRNPDGRVSNLRSGQQPRILEVPFKYGQHNLSFKNFDSANPDWGNYEDTFGTAEVWHELLDPIFGHPILTAAYFEFYKYFLKGKGNGGLATGFCTSLASLVADRFWQGRTDTPTVQQPSVLNLLTSVHGKLLSRQSLLTFHDQGRQGIDRVETTYREIEATFLRGTDRQNQPLLFFIPSGDVWDSGYFDRLSSSHCVMPWRFQYPLGRAAPQLTPDGSSTLSDPDGVELFVWDCNNPTKPDCKLRFHRDAGKIQFDFFSDSPTAEFKSQDGITLGMMRHGDYMLADHDLPFSGPFGLTSFIIDFLLSPADLQVVDPNGKRAGTFGTQILSEIPGSHPCYLMKGIHLLPAATAMTRTLVGTASGNYSYHSITPDGASILLQDVATQAGHRDVVAISADATQIRFTPAAQKNFTLSVARVVNNQARALSISGVGADPSNDLDVTLSPEMSLVRVGNKGAARNLTLKALSVTRGGTPVDRNLPPIAVPAAHDLAVTVTDWGTLDLQANAVSFQ